MDLHKPKSWHGWREFLKEFATIVLGVSVALAAEQGVEWWHWRNQVAEARQVITTELTASLIGAVNRLRTRACTGRRLDELALILDAAAKSGNLPPLGDIMMPPRQVWPDGAWESVIASQTATHFPRLQLAEIAAAYKTVQRIEINSFMEVENWNVLYTMVGPGRRLDAGSEIALRKALSSARTADSLIVGLSVQLIGRVVRLHLPIDREAQERLAFTQTQSLDQLNTCKPIGAVTRAYGQGYDAPAAAPPNVEQAMKSLRDFAKGVP